MIFYTHSTAFGGIHPTVHRLKFSVHPATFHEGFSLLPFSTLQVLCCIVQLFLVFWPFSNSLRDPSVDRRPSMQKFRWEILMKSPSSLRVSVNSITGMAKRLKLVFGALIISSCASLSTAFLDNLVVSDTLSSLYSSYLLTYSDQDFKSLNYSSTSLGGKAILGNALFVAGGKIDLFSKLFDNSDQICQD